MPTDASALLDLLDKWHRGDREALGALAERLCDWMKGQVHRKMTKRLRRHGDSWDVVQDVLLGLFLRGPAFRPQTEAQLKAIVAKAVENRLHDLYDYSMAQMRNVETVRLPSAISQIGIAAASSSEPEVKVEAEEERSFIALALELLEPRFRLIIHLRDWKGCSFQQIGVDLAIDVDAARMRYNRALRELSRMVAKLKKGRLQELMESVEQRLEVNARRPKD